MPASTDINNIILSKDRSKAGYSVPALGLSLVNVEYENDIIDERN